MAATPDGSEGYAGTFDVGLSGLPSGGSADNAVSASLGSTRFGRSGGRRVLTVTLGVDEAVSADLRLLRGSRILARRRYARLLTGTRRPTLVLGNQIVAARRAPSSRSRRCERRRENRHSLAPDPRR